MRLPPERERALILTVLREPETCVRFPDAEYRRADGALPVHRDGLQELLHRRLYRIVRDADLGRRRIERVCETPGCVNPYHYALRAGLAPGSKAQCANGHRYDEVGVTPSGHCRICAEQRARRRRSSAPDGGALNARKTHCPAAHEYDAANTYVQITPRGTRRKCRACNRNLHRMGRAEVI